MKKLSLTLILICSTSIILMGQTEASVSGTYGTYMDYSVFTELTLNANNTFKFSNQTMRWGSQFHSGHWRLHKGKIFLYCDDKNSRSMPRQWKIKENELKSEFVKTPSKKKIKYTLEKKD